MSSTNMSFTKYGPRNYVDVRTRISGLGILRTDVFVRQMVREDEEILTSRWYAVVSTKKAISISNLKQRHGITRKKAEEIIAFRKDANCEICGEKRKTLFQDHNKETERLRGLLCHRCNTLLAGLEDPLFPKLKEYLERWEL